MGTFRGEYMGTKKPAGNPPAGGSGRRTTGIEWTDHTWNPFVGCSVISAGCTNCYAMALADRLAGMGNPTYAGLTKRVHGKVYWTGEVRPNTVAAFRKPVGVPRPSIFFVNSMSDFFHANASDRMRLAALEIMRDTPRHQYQVLTKRPEAIAPFFDRTGFPYLENLWLGATVESANVRDRIDHVRRLPAAVRFLSVEPLIADPGDLELEGIDWVITGGESGPGARPMAADWMRRVRDSCLAAGTSHFFKQWGRWENNPIRFTTPPGVTPSTWVAKRDPVGKGGSLLDGEPWKEMPFGFGVAPYEKELQGDLFKA